MAEMDILPAISVLRSSEQAENIDGKQQDPKCTGAARDDEVGSPFPCERDPGVAQACGSA